MPYWMKTDVHVPEHLTDEEGATLPCVAVAWNALNYFWWCKAGDTVLVQEQEAFQFCSTALLNF